MFSASPEAFPKLLGGVRSPEKPLEDIITKMHILVPSSFVSIEGVLSEAGKALPSCDSEPVPLGHSESQGIFEVLQMYTRIANPSLLGAPERVFRPAFCRFLLDTGIVNCDDAQAQNSAKYHEAVRLFDISSIRSCRKANFGMKS